MNRIFKLFCLVKHFYKVDVKSIVLNACLTNKDVNDIGFNKVCVNCGSVVIEIKIARLGGDKSDVKINRIKKDINKLILFDKEKDQRILLCVVYKTEGAFEKGWGPFVGKGEGDYQKDIINCLKLKDLYNERNHFTCPENGMINGVREILLDCFIF